MPTLAAATPSAAASTVLAVGAVLGLCALIAAGNVRTWRRRRYGPRRRRMLGLGVEDTQAEDATPSPPADLGLPGEAAGLPKGSPTAAAAHTNSAPGDAVPSAARPPAAAPSASALAPLPPPALPGARYAATTFELAAQRLDHSRRLAILEGRVARALVTLPRDRWLVEPYVLVAGYRIPFVVLGECGVFAIFALSVRPMWQDTAYASRLAGYVKGVLPTYAGPVTPGICGVLKPELQPRYWYRSGQPGGSWVMGLDWLIPWMQHFGHDHGLGVEDIARLHDLAGPNWSRHVKPGPPPVPDIDAEVRGHE
jgi:hypothetical protein